MPTIYDGMSNHELNVEVAKRQGYRIEPYRPDRPNIKAYRLIHPNGKRQSTNKLDHSEVATWNLVPRPADDMNDAMKLWSVPTSLENLHQNKGFRCVMGLGDTAGVGEADTAPRAITIAWLTWGDYKADVK